MFRDPKNIVWNGLWVLGVSAYWPLDRSCSPPGYSGLVSWGAAFLNLLEICSQQLPLVPIYFTNLFISIVVSSSIRIGMTALINLLVNITISVFAPDLIRAPPSICMFLTCRRLSCSAPVARFSRRFQEQYRPRILLWSSQLLVPASGYHSRRCNTDQAPRLILERRRLSLFYFSSFEGCHTTVPNRP